MREIQKDTLERQKKGGLVGVGEGEMEGKCEKSTRLLVPGSTKLLVTDGTRILVTGGMRLVTGGRILLATGGTRLLATGGTILLVIGDQRLLVNGGIHKTGHRVGRGEAFQTLRPGMELEPRV